MGLQLILSQKTLSPHQPVPSQGIPADMIKRETPGTTRTLHGHNWE